MAFDYCTLPADDERSIRPFELAPVGSRRFTRSPGDFIHKGIITISRGCVVSAPLPGLSPCCSGSPLSHGEGTFLSWCRMNPRLPSAIRLLLATRYQWRRYTKAFLRQNRKISRSILSSSGRKPSLRLPCLSLRSDRRTYLLSPPHPRPPLLSRAPSVSSSPRCNCLSLCQISPG